MSSDARLRSQRLLRKGALVEETFHLFSKWCDDDSFDVNFERAFLGHFQTDAWKKEVRATIRARFPETSVSMPLIELARRGLALSDWKHCLLLIIAAREYDYWDFAVNWLFPEYAAGRYRIRTEDLTDFVARSWAASRGPSDALTEYGVLRNSRDLLRMARDLGVLQGDGPQKEFANLSVKDNVFVFACHFITEWEGSSSRIPTSALWKAFLLDTHAVEEALLRLHQFRKLNYQVAGSLVQISLPSKSALEYARRMVE